VSRILYRARTARGADVADFVEAASAAEAMQILERMELREIVLLQSPHIAAFNQPLPGLTTQQYARLRADFMAKPGLATSLRGTARINAPILSAGALALGIGAWWHLPVTATIGAVMLLFPFVAFFWKRRHLDRYLALQKAYARGQWDEVRRLAPIVRAAPGGALLPLDLDTRLACIDARQGRLDAAVASLDDWKPQLDAKAPGMFEAHVGRVYFAAGDYATHLRLVEQAAELGKQDPSRMVDVALANAKFGDARRAEDILGSLDLKLLPPLAHKFIALINGILRLREGQPDRAEPELRVATEGFMESALQTPVVWIGVAISSGYYALALARSGKRHEAQQAIAPALPILLVHGEKPLLDMLQNEVLQAAT
jgi:hypothetical protein